MTPDPDAAEPGSGPPEPAPLRRAIEFIDRHARDDVTISDVAAAARIGPRALQVAFRHHRGQTPLEYLRQVRLDGAHHDLQAADPTRGDTVAAIAAPWRFTHLGRFAATYRRRYGRQPRAVLAHVPDGAENPTSPATGAAAEAVSGVGTGVAVEVALLDIHGVIVWANRAWEEFCLAHGGDPARAGRGVSYLAVCDAAGDPASVAVAAAIRAALAGDLPAAAWIHLPCPTPERPSLFDVLISTRRGDDGQLLGATLTLSESDPVTTTAPAP